MILAMVASSRSISPRNCATLGSPTPDGAPSRGLAVTTRFETYVAALRMLAMRELSEAQIRQRLARRGHDDEAVEAAITCLKADKSIDDTRVAGAIARSETSLRKRGRLRVKRRIEAAGISSSIAHRAVEDVFAEIDPDALLSAALDKRLRGRQHIED